VSAKETCRNSVVSIESEGWICKVLNKVEQSNTERKKKSKKRQLEVLVSGNPKKKQKETQHSHSLNTKKQTTIKHNLIIKF